MKVATWAAAIAVACGVAILAAYWFMSVLDALFDAEDVPILIKIAVPAIVAGTVVLVPGSCAPANPGPEGRGPRRSRLLIVVTTDEIPGRRVDEVLGMVMANSVRAKHLGKDIMATFRNIAGGENHGVYEADGRVAGSRPAENVRKSGGDGRKRHCRHAVHHSGHSLRRVRDTRLRHGGEDQPSRPRTLVALRSTAR